MLRALRAVRLNPAGEPAASGNYRLLDYVESAGLSLEHIVLRVRDALARGRAMESLLRGQAGSVALVAAEDEDEDEEDRAEAEADQQGGDAGGGQGAAGPSGPGADLQDIVLSAGLPRGTYLGWNKMKPRLRARGGWMALIRRAARVGVFTEGEGRNTFGLPYPQAYPLLWGDWEAPEDAFYSIISSNLLIQPQLASLYQSIGTRVHMRLALRAITGAAGAFTQDGRAYLAGYDERTFVFAAADADIEQAARRRAPAPGVLEGSRAQRGQPVYRREQAPGPPGSSIVSMQGDCFEYCVADDSIGTSAAFSDRLVREFVVPSMRELPQPSMRNLVAAALERAGMGRHRVRLLATEMPVFHPFAMALPKGSARARFLQTQVDFVGLATPLEGRRAQLPGGLVIGEYKTFMEASKAGRPLPDSKAMKQAISNARMFEAMTGLRVSFCVVMVAARSRGQLGRAGPVIVQVLKLRHPGDTPLLESVASVLLEPLGKGSGLLYADAGVVAAFPDVSAFTKSWRDSAEEQQLPRTPHPADLVHLDSVSRMAIWGPQGRAGGGGGAADPRGGPTSPGNSSQGGGSEGGAPPSEPPSSGEEEAGRAVPTRRSKRQRRRRVIDSDPSSSSSESELGSDAPLASAREALQLPAEPNGGAWVADATLGRGAQFGVVYELQGSEPAVTEDPAPSRIPENYRLGARPSSSSSSSEGGKGGWDGPWKEGEEEDESEDSEYEVEEEEEESYEEEEVEEDEEEEESSEEEGGAVGVPFIGAGPTAFGADGTTWVRERAGPANTAHRRSLNAAVQDEVSTLLEKYDDPEGGEYRLIAALRRFDLDFTPVRPPSPSLQTSEPCFANT